MSRQRPHLILLICALLAVPAAAQQVGFGASAQPSGIQWQHDLEAAKATARQAGKLVLVHFWAPSCRPCLMLDHNVFNQPGVASAIESQFVPVKLNANDNVATATGFGITRLPTDVIITPDGQVVGKLISPPTPAAYVAEVSQVAAKHATQPGQAFARAAEAAPAPSLNAAYADLQIAPNTRPALEAQQTATTNNLFPTAPVPAFGAANTPDPGGFGSSPSNLGGSFTPATPTAPPLNATPLAGPSFAQPRTGAVPSPYDQYVVPPMPNVAQPNTNVAAPVSVAAPVPDAPAPVIAPPAQMVNPYTPTIPAPTMPAAAAAPVMQAAASNTAAPQTVAADARTLPPNAPPLGFDGYCPVSMRSQWKWVQGDPRWGIVHRGRTYWFAGENEQQQFWADPDRFSPALSGMDPVLAVDHRQQVPGKREHSIDYDNLFYMFSSEATLQQFTANPERYATSVRQAMGIQRGRLVR